MDIKLSADDRVRVNNNYGRLSNFIDIRNAGFCGIELTLFSGFQYIEIRKKGDFLRVFTFPKKSLKKEFDFESWADAEVIYSQNEQIMHKDS